MKTEEPKREYRYTVLTKTGALSSIEWTDKTPKEILRRKDIKKILKFEVRFIESR